MPDRSSPRVALLGFSIECNKFAPRGDQGAFSRPHLSRRRCDHRGGTLGDAAHAAGDAGLYRGDGRVRRLDAGRHRAGDDRAKRAGRARVLCRAARHDRAPAQRGFAGRRGLYLLAWGGADDRGGRSRRSAVRTVREIVGPDVPIAATLDLHANVSERMVRFGRRVHRLPDEPASRHARARRRGGRRDPRDARRRQAAARLHPPADRAADGDLADRRRPLCRDDRARPAPHEPRRS